MQKSFTSKTSLRHRINEKDINSPTKIGKNRATTCSDNFEISSNKF